MEQLELFKEEIWRDVPDYEGQYQCSNLGNVKSVDRKVNIITGKKNYFLPIKGVNLKLIDNFGYRTVCLTKHNKAEWITVHQMVAICFLNHTRCGHKLVVNHINGIKTDNRVENLEIVTQRQNVEHFFNTRKTSSNYQRVSWNEQNKKWRSNLTIKGRGICLSYFDNELDAFNFSNKAFENMDKYNGNPKDFREYLKSI